MDTNERLNLQKMIDANNVVDYTESIRDKKHSPKIRADVLEPVECVLVTYAPSTKTQKSTNSFISSFSILI